MKACSRWSTHCSREIVLPPCGSLTTGTSGQRRPAGRTAECPWLFQTVPYQTKPQTCVICQNEGEKKTTLHWAMSWNKTLSYRVKLQQGDKKLRSDLVFGFSAYNEPKAHSQTYLQFRRLKSWPRLCRLIFTVLKSGCITSAREWQHLTKEHMFMQEQLKYMHSNRLNHTEWAWREAPSLAGCSSLTAALQTKLLHKNHVIKPQPREHEIFSCCTALLLPDVCPRPNKNKPLRAVLNCVHGYKNQPRLCSIFGAPLTFNSAGLLCYTSSSQW